MAPYKHTVEPAERTEQSRVFKRFDASFAPPMIEVASSYQAPSLQRLSAYELQRRERQRQRRRKGHGMLFESNPLVDNGDTIACDVASAATSLVVSTETRTCSDSPLNRADDDGDSDIDAISDTTVELAIAQRGVLSRAILVRLNRRFLGFQRLAEGSSKRSRASRADTSASWLHKGHDIPPVPALSPEPGESRGQSTSPDSLERVVTPPNPAPRSAPITSPTHAARPPLRRGITYFPLMLDHPSSMSALLMRSGESTSVADLPPDPPGRTNTRSVDRKGLPDIGGAWDRVKGVWGGNDKRLRTSVI